MSIGSDTGADFPGSPQAGEPGGHGRGPGLPLSGGVLGLLVAGAFLLLRTQALEPSRPSIESAQMLLEQEVRARLWEDPFAAVDRHIRRLDTRYRPPTAPDLRPAAAPGRIGVLAVMVFGGPYDEQAERRLRSRHAVLSGLGELGYVPEDSEHIGHFLHDIGGRYEVVPYETFRRGQGQDGERLLLLWLKEGSFRPRPLAQLAGLFEDLGVDRAAGTGDGRGGGVALTLLGPNGSTSLRALVEELAACERRPDELAILGELDVYSPSATIANELLPLAGLEGQTLDESFRACTGGAGRLLRTIGTDRQLADTLVRELDRRGVEVMAREKRPKLPACQERAQCEEHVALISEWDTDYGRGLPCAFVASALGRYTASCEAGTASGEASWIHRFSYLRGLDGQLPREPGARQEDETAAAAGDGSREALVERPVGRRRLDYVRRLAAQLEVLDTSLRARAEGFEPSQGLKAVGVLGSDVFDKLLMLQALRERFPHVIFFTTDLDASLLHPGEYRSTRNLIVVSNFGLRLDRGLQMTSPAFRDNYQTSLFFSTKLALDPEIGATFGRQEALDHHLIPRIFEIGRSGAFDLSRPREPELEATAGLAIHPPRTDHLAARESLWRRGPLAVAVVATILLLALWWHFYRDPEPEAVDHWRLRAGFAAALIGGFAILSLLIAGQDWQGEPFLLFEGVSVWPALYLRLVVFVLSLYFVCASWRQIAASDADLVARFHMGGAGADGLATARSGGARSLVRLAVQRLRRLTARPLSSPVGLVGIPLDRPGGGPRPAAALRPATQAINDATLIFREYRRRGRLSRRLLRAAPLAATYFVLCRMLILTVGEPSVPYRDDVSYGASQIVTLALAVPALVFLIFWIVDATKLSVWLTRSLAGCETRWPVSTLGHFSAKLRLDSELLVGWLDIQAIARSSETVGRLVYTPILVMILMVASRATFFDNWNFPVGLCVVVSISILYLIYCASILRRSAEHARSVTLRRYQTALLQAEGSANVAAARQIRLLLDQVAALRVGAFVPFSQQPWVRAVGLLFGGGGTLILVEYLVWLS